MIAIKDVYTKTPLNNVGHLLICGEPADGRVLKMTVSYNRAAMILVQVVPLIMSVVRTPERSQVFFQIMDPHCTVLRVSDRINGNSGAAI